MKKTYIIPELLMVKVNVKHHLMDLSVGGTASISSEAADGDAFVKDNRSNYNVWNDDWSE